MAATSTAPATPIVVPAGISAILSGVKERWSGLSSSQRPWTELIDRSAISKPESLAEVKTDFAASGAFASRRSYHATVTAPYFFLICTQAATRIRKNAVSMN